MVGDPRQVTYLTMGKNLEKNIKMENKRIYSKWMQKIAVEIDESTFKL